MDIYIVYFGYSIRQKILTRRMERRLIGNIPVSSHYILPYLKGRPWDQLPAEVQKRGDEEPGTARRKPKTPEWAIPVNEHEWRYIQKCWTNQSPGLVFINSKNQLRQDVIEITGDHSDAEGVDFGITFNFVADITGVSPQDIHIEEIYNDARRHALLAKSCLKQIKILGGQIPPAVADDFADLDITLDEFFIGAPSGAAARTKDAPLMPCQKNHETPANR
jgi:hypothetical protein